MTGTCLLYSFIAFLMMLLPAQAGTFAWMRTSQRRRSLL